MRTVVVSISEFAYKTHSSNLFKFSRIFCSCEDSIPVSDLYYIHVLAVTVKAEVNTNSSEILGSLKRDLKGKK